MPEEKRWWQGAWAVVGGFMTVVGFLIALYQFWPDIFGPSITTFQTNDNTYTRIRGGEAIFTWKVDGNPEDVLLNGRRVTDRGEMMFDHLTKDQVFTLEARKRWGRTESRSRAIYVIPPPLTITAFDASPNPIKPNTETNLTWEVSSNAEMVRIEPLIGIVGRKGSRPVSIKDTTTFTITATARETQDVSRQVTVELLQTQLLFRAEPPTIRRGESTRLVWQTNAPSIAISPSVGTFSEPSGETSVAPEGTVTYEAVADGPGGAQRISLEVTVLPPVPPNLQAWVVPSRIMLGQSAIVQWQAAYAEKIVITENENQREFGPSDHYEFHPTQKGRIRLPVVAIGPGGERSTTVDLDVLPPPRQKIMILSSGPNAGFAESAIASEMTDMVASYVRGHGYDVLLPPSNIRSAEQFLDLARRPPQPGFQVPDLVIELTLEAQQQTRKTTKSAVGDFVRGLSNPRGSVEDIYVELLITCVSKVRIVRMPAGTIITATPGIGQKKQIVERNQVPNLAYSNSELTRIPARQATEAALNNLNLASAEDQ